MLQGLRAALAGNDIPSTQQSAVWHYLVVDFFEDSPRDINDIFCLQLLVGDLGPRETAGSAAASLGVPPIPVSFPGSIHLGTRPLSHPPVPGCRTALQESPLPCPSAGRSRTQPRSALPVGKERTS